MSTWIWSLNLVDRAKCEFAPAWKLIAESKAWPKDTRKLHLTQGRSTQASRGHSRGTQSSYSIRLLGRDQDDDMSGEPKCNWAIKRPQRSNREVARGHRLRDDLWFGAVLGPTCEKTNHIYAGGPRGGLNAPQITLHRQGVAHKRGNTAVPI